MTRARSLLVTRAPAASRVTPRLTVIDVAKALVVIGVVFNHTVNGLVNARILTSTNPIVALNDVFYIVRMPALAFLLGLVMPRAVESRGSRAFVTSRVVQALYLYLVWYVVQGLAELVTSPVRNQSRDLGSLFTVWVTFAHLWFLPFLAVAATVIALCRPWVDATSAGCCLTGLAALSVATWGWNPQIVGLDGLSLLFFVACGAAVGLDRLRRLNTLTPQRWGLTGVVALGAFLPLLLLHPTPATWGRSPSLAHSAISLVTAAAGIIVVLTLAVALARLRWAERLLSAIGRQTLPVYLAHVIVVAGVRIGLTHLGVQSVPVLLAVAVPLGVAIPVAVYAGALRSPFTSWPFVVPSFRGCRESRISLGQSNLGSRPARRGRDGLG